MSASAILSTVTVPLAGLANGSSADASTSAGEFAAVLSAEVVEAADLFAPTMPDVPANMLLASPPVEPAVAPLEASSASEEAIGAPFWLQMAAVAVPELAAQAAAQDISQAAEALPSAEDAPRAVSEPVFATRPDRALAAEVQAVPDQAVPEPAKVLRDDSLAAPVRMYQGEASAVPVQPAEDEARVTDNPTPRTEAWAGPVQASVDEPWAAPSQTARMAVLDTQVQPPRMEALGGSSQTPRTNALGGSGPTSPMEVLGAQAQSPRNDVPDPAQQTKLSVRVVAQDMSPVPEKATAVAVAPLPEGTAQRPSSPAGEAALASLRAMPGAATLQQVTLTQRRIEPTSTGATPTVRDEVEDPAVSTQRPGPVEKIVPDVEPKSGKDLAPVKGPAAAPVNAVVDIAARPQPLAGSTIELLPLLPEALPSSSDGDGTALASLASSAAGPAAAFTSIDTSSLSSLSRATIETTAQLAAQITQRLAGQSTRFELGLTPEGLGRVDVTLDIDSDGQLSARLAFDNPLAATELRGRADDLRRQLEDAGFTVARDALEFSSRDSSSGGGTDRRQQRATAYADRHAAQSDLVDTPPAWTLPSSSLTPRGVDVKV